MPTEITQLQPNLLWRHFHALSQVPRPSRHEAQVQAFIQQFGEQQGLQTLRDQVSNLLIRKPATSGMEGRAGVILQGHLDMVPQANSDSQHDFQRDPIQTRIDGEWVTASGTTLGADNGIGVAAMMAVLSANDLRHGPIEALFTCNEESGMDGAFGLQAGVLQGEILINTDSEQEGELCIGCAGGANVNSTVDYPLQPVDSGWKHYRIALTGLKGGHSGIDIHRGRGNAVALMARLLRQIETALPLQLATVDAGNMRNAIPREAFAVIAIQPDDSPQLASLLAQWQKLFRAELALADPLIELTGERYDWAVAGWLGATVRQQLIDVLCACPNGVVRMSDSVPGLVESSNNLAIVHVAKGRVEIRNLVRSSVDSARDALCERLLGLFRLIGADSSVDGHYPGWTPNPGSAILQVVQQVHRSVFDQPATVGAMHAGLECGIIGARYPQLDMISFGPTIRFPHSPDERVNIVSVGRFWTLLVATLAQIPEHKRD